MLSNEEMELLPRRTRIVVEPALVPPSPQSLIVEARTITQLGAHHLNASAKLEVVGSVEMMEDCNEIFTTQITIKLHLVVEKFR